MTQLALTPAASQQAAGIAIRAEVRNLVIHGANPDALLAAIAVDMEVAPLTDVDSDEMAAEMQAMLGRLSTVQAAIENERKQRKAPLIEASAWLDGGYTPMSTRIGGIITAGKLKLSAYATKLRQEAEERRRVEEAKRRAEAEEKALQEAAAIAEANAAAERAQALRAAGSEDVAQALEQQAMAAVDTARQNAAAAVQALHVAPLSPVSKVKGQSLTWKAEVTDKALLIAHIGAMVAKGDKSLIELLEVSDKAINAMAKLQQQHLSLPGVRPISEQRQAIKKVAVAA